MVTNAPQESSFPLGLLEKGDEVATLVDSSLMGKRFERHPLSRENAGSSPAKDLGVLVLAFSHLKPTATTWSGRSVLELFFPHLKPTATTWSGRGGEHVHLVERRAVAAASLLLDAWLGRAALGAQAPLPFLRGAALETRTPVVELMPWLTGTALGARVPFADHGRGERRTKLVFQPSKLYPD